MSDPAQIEVFPEATGDGWNWRQGAEDGPGYDNRHDAIEGARAEGGAEEVTVTRVSGAKETHLTPPVIRIVLLRRDGTEVGELDPPPSEAGPVQQITLAPVAETSEAVTE